MSRIDAFEAMLARGQDSEMLRHTLGTAYLQAGDAARAVEHFARAVEIKPSWSAAWKMLGRARAAAGERAAALDAFDRGLEVAAANGDVQVTKEIGVFRRRVEKAMAAEPTPGDGPDASGDAPDAG